MIPICRDPKRFVASLNKERAISTLMRSNVRSNQQQAFCVRAAVVHSSQLPSFYVSNSYVSPPISNYYTPTRSFSTAMKFDESRIMGLDSTPTVTVTSTTATATAPSTPQYHESMPLFGPRPAEWWTGKRPKLGECPGMAADGKLYSLPQLTFDAGSFTKEKLQAYFDNTWTLTEVLFGALQGEESFHRPPYHDLRHPMIFYYGHPATLYINKLRVAGLIKDSINPYFESIFETGVDEMSWDDLSKNKMPWPSVAEVHAYRKQVYATISNLIASLTPQQCATLNQSSPLWALVMSFEHERIHIETSSFLMNELPLQHLRFPDGFPAYHPSTPSPATEVLRPEAGVHYPVNRMVEVPQQKVSIGKPRDFPSFGWDNEYGHREYDVPAFKASQFKVSNGEFLEFMKESGYSKREYWTDLGWKWRAFRNVKWPTMWQRKGPQGHHEYDLRLIFDAVPMAWNWPVVVNYHEAVAFCKWKSQKTGKLYRVLTEVEHRAIRDPQQQGSAAIEDDYVTKFAGNEMKDYNTNLAYASMSPVDAMQANSKGFSDVFGNAWEWTEDYFSPLPGFQVHPFYEDFSTPCFDGLHNVIQGGSFISTGNEASVHSRFHFRPHFFQHASFRIVEQLSSNLVTSDTDAPGPFVGNYPFRRSQEKMLESMKAADNSAHNLNALLSKHFGSITANLLPGLTSTKNSMESLQSLILESVRNMKINPNQSNVIEVGCGPGGLSFQLARQFDSVIGIDHHADSVDFAKNVAAQPGPNQYALVGEGELQESFNISKPKDITAKQIDFRCADPMCLPAEMKSFDVVVLNDVIDKVSSPNSVLGRLGGVRGLVRDGGALVVISAYQWSEDRTPKSLWLGGYQTPAGDVVSSEQTLIERLSADFEVRHSTKFPMLWLESIGDVRGKVYQVTVLQRK